MYPLDIRAEGKNSRKTVREATGREINRAEASWRREKRITPSEGLGELTD